jgi:putative ATP-dependent endonuclease of the OLD family
MEWLSDPSKSVQVAQPVAGLKTGDGDFIGELTRMGHGLQRSYLLSLLQEHSSSELPDAPTLILGCEEPELNQHPPQALHIADVFASLTESNNQVLVTTHSPYFVNGDGFENVRLVRTTSKQHGSKVSCLTYLGLRKRIRKALGEDPVKWERGACRKDLTIASSPHC